MAFRKVSHCSIQCSAIKYFVGGEFTFFFFGLINALRRMQLRSISYVWCLGVRVLFVSVSCGHSNERMTSFAY